MTDPLRVEVVYALPDRQQVVTLALPAGTTLGQAIEASGLRQGHPEINTDSGRFGIFARPARLDTVLRDCDRVEIYRPLIADPKEVRRQRAAEGRAMKKGASGRLPAG